VDVAIACNRDGAVSGDVIPSETVEFGWSGGSMSGGGGSGFDLPREEVLKPNDLGVGDSGALKWLLRARGYDSRAEQ
jgi:hypothetical protein